MLITSVRNERIKELRSLAVKKYREKSGLYLAEGIKPVTEAINAGKPVKCIFGTAAALARIPVSSAEIFELTETVFASVSTEVNPEGVIAEIALPDLTPEVCRGNCLLLDGIKDPGNLGTIIRTAAAAGFNDVFLLGTADPFSPKVVRASMSGIFFVKISEVTAQNFKDFIHVPLIAADMCGENAFTVKPAKPFCLAIGSEASGISEEVRLAANQFVGIPMESRSESLNASVAAGILMYVLKN